MKRARFLLLPLLLAAGCRAPETIGNNVAGAPGATDPAAEGGDSETAQPVQTATLTGLYESGAASRRSQMCVVERGGSARFGLVIWSGQSDSCSGSGTAARQGDRLRLSMEGDEPCTVEARIEGTRVTFPASVPASCAYYCSRGGRIAGATLDKTGGAEADALRAEDLVGDRLC